MILNLSIDEQIVQRAQKLAEGRGMSLEQFVQQFLKEVTYADRVGQSVEEWIEELYLTPQPSVEEDISELRRLSGQGHSGGWKFNREELYDRGSKD